jgi:large subunit ribosomal protein L18
MNKSIKQQKRTRRRKKIRAKVSGTPERPRLSVFKSNTLIYAQLIDDLASRTLASARGKDAANVGAEVAKLAMGKKIDKVVFDRGGYMYTGKVLALVEAARKGGLKF